MINFRGSRREPSLNQSGCRFFTRIQGLLSGSCNAETSILINDRFGPTWTMMQSHIFGCCGRADGEREPTMRNIIPIGHKELRHMRLHGSGMGYEPASIARISAVVKSCVAAVPPRSRVRV